MNVTQSLSDNYEQWDQLDYQEKEIEKKIDQCYKQSELQTLLELYERIRIQKKKLRPNHPEPKIDYDQYPIYFVQNDEILSTNYPYSGLYSSYSEIIAPEFISIQDVDIQIEEIQAVQHFTCPICYEQVGIDKCYQLIECGHQYCQDCLEEYLRIKIINGKVLKIKCPNPTCLNVVQPIDVHSIVDDEISSKYEDFTLQQFLRTQPNVWWCPRVGCRNALIGDPANPKIHCEECQHDYCFNCNEEWHINSCEEYQKWKTENGKVDKEFNKWANEFTKPCPRCRIRTEKFFGCNHMTCAFCQYEWCWICSGELTDNHYSMYNMFGCPGLQFSGDEDEHNLLLRTQAKRFAAKLLLGLFAFPVVLVGAPVVAVRRVQEWHRRRVWRKQNNNANTNANNNANNNAYNRL